MSTIKANELTSLDSGNSITIDDIIKATEDLSQLEADLSSNQTVDGIKTFLSFPVTPSAAPTDDYQAANKKYVDDMGELRVKWVSGDKIITVADSSADFTTVMGAIAEAMKWRSIDGSVIVEIQSGYLVTEQLFFIDNDYSHINVKAQGGATIIVDHNSMSVTNFDGLGFSGFIACARGKSPMFQTQFEFLTRPAGKISGALAVFNGEIYFGNNSGVKNAGALGAYGYCGGSITMGDGNNFSGAGGNGAGCTTGGSVSMGNYNDFSGAGANGVYGWDGGSVSMGNYNDFSGAVSNGAASYGGGSLAIGNVNDFSGAGENGTRSWNGGTVTMGDVNNLSGVGVGNYSFLVSGNGFIQAGLGTIFTAGRERSQAAYTINANGLIMG